MGMTSACGKTLDPDRRKDVGDPDGKAARYA